jgi:hypothetical protein
MDLAAAFQVWSDGAIGIDRRSCQLAGGWVSIVVPIDGLPADDLRHWVVEAATCPLPERLQAAFRLDEQLAWRLLDALPINHVFDQRSQLILAHWQAQRLAQASATAGPGSIVVLPSQDRALAAACARAHYHLARIFRGQAPWQGPLLLSRQRALLPELPADGQLLARPLMPALLIDAPAGDRSALEDRCAAVIIDCLLARLRRNQGHWPDWLRQGLIGVVAERSRGQGPSPLGMLRRRQEAPPGALFAALDRNAPIDAALATALVAPLVHSRRVERFASFLDLLRNGVPTIEALALAYSLDLKTLLDQP